MQFPYGCAINLALSLCVLISALIGLTGCSSDDVVGPDNTVPEDVVREDVRWKQIVGASLGYTGYRCGLSEDGRVFCWGRNTTGVVRAAPAEAIREPVHVEDAPAFVQIATGLYFVCGLTADGRVFCWGHFGHIESSEIQSQPVLQQLESTGSITSIAATYHELCGLDNSGRVACWQSISSASDRFVPPQRLTDLSAEDSLYCGVSLTGGVYCWGSGYLGRSDREYSDRPVRVTSNEVMTSVSAGRDLSCSLDEQQRAWCWGRTRTYDGGVSLIGSSVPVAVDGSGTYTAITVGDDHMCALTPDGRAECWGSNWAGQLGDGTETSRPHPAPVESELRFVSISAIGNSSCGITAEGDAWCWGYNALGLLGSGESYGPGPWLYEFSPRPVKVLDPVM